jgi:hypothetical protein
MRTVLSGRQRAAASATSQAAVALLEQIAVDDGLRADMREAAIPLESSLKRRKRAMQDRLWTMIVSWVGKDEAFRPPDVFDTDRCIRLGRLFAAGTV